MVNANAIQQENRIPNSNPMRESVRQAWPSHTTRNGTRNFRSATRAREKANWTQCATRLFWVFVLFSVLGLVLEEIYHLALFGEIQDRAGLLVGPFSPIYGVGAVILTIVSRKTGSLSIMQTFLLSAVACGVVEYATNWLMETAFGMVSWDYSGNWLSVGGRTCGFYMILWGFLGTVVLKFVMPALQRSLFPLLEQIPRLLTIVCMSVIAIDIALTLVTVDCWHDRQAGEIPTSHVQLTCATYFNDDFMASRFESIEFVQKK